MAIDCLEKSRSFGADVSTLTLARCYWEVGKLPESAKEFRHAIERKEAPEFYLKLCLHAVQSLQVSTTQATAQNQSGPGLVQRVNVVASPSVPVPHGKE